MREWYPVIKPRIWGGARLREWFPSAPADQAIGEAWLLSDHPVGRTLDDQGEPITGTDDPSKWFPVLIKVLHANTDLSVQVHPDDQMAAVIGDRGKTEGWLILEAAADAKICYGHHFASPNEMRQAIEHDQLMAGLRYLPVKAGEYYPIPAGTVHALGAGIVVLEVQQASDLTYRLYDYGRLEQGKPRQLHVEQGIAATAFPQQVNAAQVGVLDRLEGWFVHPVYEALRYDRQPYFEFASLLVDGNWNNQLQASVSLIVILLSGDVHPIHTADTDSLFRTWLFAPGESIQLVGKGKVALISVPQQ